MSKTDRVLWPILLALLLLGGGIVAWAQSTAGLSIAPPEVGDFPQVNFYLEAFDEAGAPISDLQASEVTVIENGLELALTSLTREQPGLQVILAFNTGGGMAYSYEGSSRFEWVKQAILDWVAQQPAMSLDVYHLITNNGEEPRRLQSAAAIFSALQVYQPDLLNTFPASQTLDTALDTGTQPLPNAYSRRSILLVTGLPRGDFLGALPAQTERAAQIGVPVNIWLVGGEDVRDSYGATLLQELAGRTGGAYHFFSGPEGFPSPEDYVAGLRYVYAASYRSEIRQAGSYLLQGIWRRGDQEVLSNERTFQVPYSLPSPIFLNLPSRVDLPHPPFPEFFDPLLTDVPFTVPVSVLIEFPDGQPRPLRESRLFVDGALLAANSAEPFDQFTWSPEIATQTRQYTLRVEVEDERGLLGATIDTLVEVGLPAPETSEPLIGFADMLVRIAIVVGLILLTIFLGWRLMRRARRNPPGKQARVAPDPRPRPAPAASAEHSFLLGRVAPAHLLRLSPEGTPIQGQKYLLLRREVLLGSDAHKATLVFDEPSLHGVHARLLHEGNVFKITDSGSVAGTWVNYQQVSAQGQALEHGDLIQLGRLALRFELTHPKNLPQPRVLPYTES